MRLQSLDLVLLLAIVCQYDYVLVSAGGHSSPLQVGSSNYQSNYAPSESSGYSPTNYYPNSKYERDPYGSSIDQIVLSGIFVNINGLVVIKLNDPTYIFQSICNSVVVNISISLSCGDIMWTCTIDSGLGDSCLTLTAGDIVLNGGIGIFGSWIFVNIIDSSNNFQYLIDGTAGSLCIILSITADFQTIPSTINATLYVDNSTSDYVQQCGYNYYQPSYSSYPSNGPPGYPVYQSSGYPVYQSSDYSDGVSCNYGINSGLITLAGYVSNLGGVVALYIDDLNSCIWSLLNSLAAPLILDINYDAGTFWLEIDAGSPLSVTLTLSDNVPIITNVAEVGVTLVIPFLDSTLLSQIFPNGTIVSTCLTLNASAYLQGVTEIITAELYISFNSATSIPQCSSSYYSQGYGNGPSYGSGQVSSYNSYEQALAEDPEYSRSRNYGYSNNNYGNYGQNSYNNGGGNGGYSTGNGYPGNTGGNYGGSSYNNNGYPGNTGRSYGGNSYNNNGGYSNGNGYSGNSGSYNNDNDNYNNNYQPSEYRSSRQKKSPDSMGHMNLYFRTPSYDGRRKKPKRMRFPAAQYERRRFPNFGPLISFFPWLPIFADRLSKQTIIFSPTGGVYIIPPVINFYGKLYSVAELIASGYCSLVSAGTPPPAAIDVAPLVQPAPVVGPGIPTINPATGGFKGGVKTQFRSLDGPKYPKTFQDDGYGGQERNGGPPPRSGY